MTRASRRSAMGRLAGPLVIAIMVIMVAIGARWAWRTYDDKLVHLTGEEEPLPQAKALSDLAAGLFRPRLNLAPDAPIQHSDVNPFGVNVFLNNEVDLAKRELTVRLAAEAGFHWLRQEFPWEDIEIHAKGDFEDRRHSPAQSAWLKYDNIVDLTERHGMELIVRVSTPPDWTRASDSVGSFAPPDRYEDFGDFVYALVSRYRGRIRYYQLWNEPNIYPEWGSYPISPEDYTRLLKIGATRAREADPNVVVICGALASTIALQPSAEPPYNALNDLIFLQRMYDAGAAPYFDIMAMQAYGLWSGPDDRRMHPRVMNYARPEYVRDLMVANGDAHKPIWISEMAWNAVPDEIPDQRFGQVTPEQQGRYAVRAYQRALEEWPWVGVVNTWYFKRATDDWVRERKPEAYFRLADPDFTLQPAYHSLKAYMTGYKATLQRGTRSPASWGSTFRGTWEVIPVATAPYGAIWQGARADASLTFAINGSALALQVVCAGRAPCGALKVTLDNAAPVTIQVTDTQLRSVSVASRLPAVTHQVVIEAVLTSPDALPGLAALAIQ